MRTMALSMMNPDLLIIMAKLIIGGHVLQIIEHKPMEPIVLLKMVLQIQVCIVAMSSVFVLL